MKTDTTTDARARLTELENETRKKLDWLADLEERTEAIFTKEGGEHGH